jgi:hypothetical protein
MIQGSNSLFFQVAAITVIDVKVLSGHGIIPSTISSLLE